MISRACPDLQRPSSQGIAFSISLSCVCVRAAATGQAVHGTYVREIHCAAATGPLGRLSYQCAQANHHHHTHRPIFDVRIPGSLWFLWHILLL
ncbi:hypothetical protein HYPSUDRAFT_220392 [Hypholoma sublateritium FD-334 SS-4]|uniref:Uncharacterized protein n=1 Tax=Hypholoma sublateritium (strain FD-334 SS-4) TaxID=945553 RepID=A0A0D2NDI6_HYPSF|nr:hypothetical protein HYPSUDRAFT_220392 [Hypholoma sublateritium FD-334 SS-4]